ncbi:GntR family transcriptional regulator [Georgenia deserti]|uniref:GntR family transcriptional regulator n=1 Tax=Georgenia deserti TaxID=2093781 RepID=A0ABW4L9S6_9MICO
MSDLSARDLARQLCEEYASLAPGTRVGSEHELARRFGVSRSVVRSAVDELVGRFLLRRVQGAGTYVNQRVDYLISSRHPPSLHRTVAAAGGEARTFLLDVTEAPVPDDVAAHLGCVPGTRLTRLVRLGYVDTLVANTVEEWLSAGVLEHADISLRAVESLNEVLRMGRHDPIRAWSRAAPDFPPAHVAARLDLDHAAPVWIIETVTRDGSTRAPLMYSRSWMRQDVIRLVFEFDNPVLADD